MTWFIISIILAGILKFVTNPPSAVVSWLLSKFELQPELSPEDVTVIFHGEELKGEEKRKFVDHFNEATFLEKYFFMTGNEDAYLHPKTNVSPFVINTKRGTKDVNFYIYCYDDHVDVVKQYKKKVIPYRLRSDYLQTPTIPTSR